MRELLPDLETWRASGVDVADVGRAVVVRTFGSAPRPEGATLLVSPDGRLAGSISGGCVEGAAFQEVQQARAAGMARVIRYGISDEQAWDVGLACGGTIDVLMEPRLPEAVRAAAAGREGRAMVTPLPAGSPGPEFGPHPPGQWEPLDAPLEVSEDGRLTGTLGDQALDGQLIAAARKVLDEGLSRTVEIEGRSLFVEAFPAAQRLIIVGAVQVAMPLVRFAKALGYETIVVDGRATFATVERFPDADRVMVGWPDEIADEIGLGPADCVA
ncbi:MAG: XdhC family protein, partial [Candidatus Limnocylindrales bacterium]